MGDSILGDVGDGGGTVVVGVAGGGSGRGSSSDGGRARSCWGDLQVGGKLALGRNLFQTESQAKSKDVLTTWSRCASCENLWLNRVLTRHTHFYGRKIVVKGLQAKPERMYLRFSGYRKSRAHLGHLF